MNITQKNYIHNFNQFKNINTLILDRKNYKLAIDDDDDFLDSNYFTQHNAIYKTILFPDKSEDNIDQESIKITEIER